MAEIMPRPVALPAEGPRRSSLSNPPSGSHLWQQPSSSETYGFGLTNTPSSTSLREASLIPQTKRAPPSSISNYRIGKTVGKGVYSVVKCAEHMMTGQNVAIKIVELGRLNEQELTTLTREMQVLKLLNHPNIVKLYEIIQSSKQFYLVQELVDGTTLHEHMLKLHGKGMGETVARKVFRQLLSAIQYCHARRVVHRDLKTNNIMVDGEGTVKLIDFGLSRCFEGNLSTHCGTPVYAAPELYGKGLYNGPAVDIWALGVIMYRIVVGVLPFSGPGYQSRIQVGNYKPPTGFSQDFQNLIVRMLDLDPTKRATAEELMAHPWTNYKCGIRLRPVKDAPVIDTQVLGVMEKFGYETEEVVQALETNVFNHITATYCLLMAQRERGCSVDIQKLFLPPPPTAAEHGRLAKTDRHIPKAPPQPLTLASYRSVPNLSSSTSGSFTPTTPTSVQSSLPHHSPGLALKKFASLNSNLKDWQSPKSPKLVVPHSADSIGKLREKVVWAQFTLPKLAAPGSARRNSTAKEIAPPEKTTLVFPLAEDTIPFPRPGLRFAGVDGSLNVVHDLSITRQNSAPTPHTLLKTEREVQTLKPHSPLSGANSDLTMSRAQTIASPSVERASLAVPATRGGGLFRTPSKSTLQRTQSALDDLQHMGGNETEGDSIESMPGREDRQPPPCSSSSSSTAAGGGFSNGHGATNEHGKSGGKGRKGGGRCGTKIKATIQSVLSRSQVTLTSSNGNLPTGSQLNGTAFPWDGAKGCPV